MAAFTALTPDQIAADPTLVSNALLPVSNGITIDPGSVHVVSGAASVGTYDGSLSALGIGAGLIITSGIMPGTTNTSTSFGQDNGMTGNTALDAVVNSVFQTVSLDATTISFSFTVTDPAITGMSFNVVFGSDEFPEWVNQFVDIGAVFVNGQNVAYFNNNPQAPLSVIGSNLAAGYFQNNADNHLPIEYDGVSAPLTINAPVHLGVNTIMIGIADTRDHILDSGMIISGLQGTNLPVTGVTLTHDGTEGDDFIQGTDAAESINLMGGNDTTDAGKGNDVIVGGLGDDVIMGGGGNDFIDGGAGNDKVVYAFAAADYAVTKMTDGSYVVVDLRPGSPDGTDTIVNVETASFSDGIYSLDALSNVTNPAVLTVGGPVAMSVQEDAAIAIFDKSALLSTTVDSNVLADLKIVNMQTELPAGVAYYETAATLSPGDGYYIPPVTIPAGNFLTIDTSNAAYQHLAEGETMEVTVSYSVTDGTNTTPTTAIFTVVGTNDAPIVSAPVVAAATEDGVAVTVNALANATDVDNGAVLSVTNAPPIAPPTTDTSTGSSGGHGVDDAANGTANAPSFDLANLPTGVSFDAATNSFTIDPSNAAFQSLAAGQTRTVTVDYDVSDGTVATAASVSFTVTGANDAPVVSGPVATLFVNQGSGAASYDLPALLSTTTDPDQGTHLTASIDPAQLPDGVTYTETPEMVVLGYVIPAHVIPAGPRGTSWGGYIYPAQYIPEVIVPDQVTPATKTLTIDSSNPAYASLAQGEELQLVVNYTVSDGTVSVPAQAIFTINGMNDAPVVSGPVTASATEGAAVVTVDAFANAIDIDHGTILSVVATPPLPPATPGADSPQDVIEAAALAAAAPVVSGPFDASTLPAGVTFNAATHSFSIDPTNAAYAHLSAGQTEQITVNYGVSDGFTTAAASAVFTVIGTNNAPIVGAPQSFAVTASSAAFIVNPTANVSDIDTNDHLSVVSGSLPGFIHQVAIPGGYYQPDIIVNQFDPNDASFRALAAGEVANFTWNYQVTDGTSVVNDSMSFTVTGVNDAPIITTPAYASVTEDAAVVTVNALANAIDLDHGAVISVVNVPGVLPAGVTYDATTHSFSINPADASFQQLAQGEVQHVLVTYGVSDGTATTLTTMQFDVVGTNDSPIVSGPVTATPNEGSGIVSVNATGNATDVDAHQGLQVTGVPAILPAGVTYDAASQRFLIDTNNPAFDSLAKGESLDVTVSYNVFDGFVEVPTSVVFSIQGKNDAPVVAGVVEAGAVSEDASSVAINLLAQSSDVDIHNVLSVQQGQGNTVTASVVGGTWASPIAFTMSGNTLNLDPAQFAGLRTGQTVDVVFNYTVTDGTAGIAVPASAHVTIIGANDAPANITLSSNHVMENALGGTVIGQLSAVNPDIGETVSYQIVSDPSGFFALNGTSLVVAAGAALDYETMASYSVDVMATDSSGLSTTRTLVIAVDDQLGVVINGSSGNDTYNLTTGTPRPTEEGDTINGNGGNDTIDGLAGNDIIDGGQGLDTILGGAGNDTINGGRDADNINAGAGNDRILISQDEALNDIFNGGSGTDTLVAVAGKQLTLNGFDATATSIEVWEGNGLGVIGTSAAQTFDFSGLSAITNMGIVDAADGADTMIGSSFADNFRGGAGNDILRGNAGNDILDGGAGNDIIYGGAGSDVLTGGANNDTFVFNKPATGSGVDNITDFVTAVDKIALVGADFGLAAGLIAAGDFVLGTTANAAHQQFIYDAGSKTLFWDADGTGGTAAVALTTFTTAANLHLADLLVV